MSFKLYNLTRNENTHKILQEQNNNDDDGKSFFLYFASVRIWKTMKGKPNTIERRHFHIDDHRCDDDTFVSPFPWPSDCGVCNAMTYIDKRANEQMEKKSRKTYF